MENYRNNGGGPGNIIIRLVNLIKHFIKKLVRTSTWQKKRNWLKALICLRLLYAAMNRFALNPWKKSLKNDHVFITGAGSGLGRGLAIKLGKMGCKLSLNDIDMQGL